MKVLLYVNRVFAVGFLKNAPSKLVSKIYILTDYHFYQLQPSRYDRRVLAEWICQQGDMDEVLDMRLEFLDEFYDFRRKASELLFTEEDLSLQTVISNGNFSMVGSSDAEKCKAVESVLVDAARDEMRLFLEKNQKQILNKV